MKNCDQCEHYFDQLKEESPCAKCLGGQWGDGFRRASILTRIEILKHRIKKLLER